MLADSRRRHDAHGLAAMTELIAMDSFLLSMRFALVATPFPIAVAALLTSTNGQEMQTAVLPTGEARALTKINSPCRRCISGRMGVRRQKSLSKK
jgi:hypothetical protein